MENLYDPGTKWQLQAATTADHLGMVETVTGGAIASLVDAGTTIWNSLTPKKYEASTSDLLSRISDNAQQVYNENTSAVQAASFFVGIVAPIGLAMKGMGAARQGMKGSSWFSREVAQGSRLQEVEAAFANSVGNTEKVMQMQNSYYLAKGLNVVADNVAAEVAINIAMSAHPWMEDYQKDLASNFLFGVALGSGIGGAFTYIGARSAVTEAKMNVQKPLFNIISKSRESVDVAENAGENFMRRSQTINNMQAHLDNASSNTVGLYLSPNVQQNLKLAVQEETALLRRDLLAASSEEIGKMPVEFLENLTKTISAPRFAEMDNLGFLNIPAKAKSSEGKKQGMLQAVGEFFKITSAPSPTLVGPVQKITAAELVYLPQADAFVPKADAVNYASIADTGLKSVDEVAGKINPNDYFKARVDAVIDLQTAPTHLQELDQAKAFLYADKALPETMRKVPTVIATQDLNLLNAFQTKLEKMMAAGDDVSGIKFRLTDEAPSYAARQQQAVMGGGFSSTYLDDLAQLDKARAQHQLYDYESGEAVAGLTEIAVRGIKNWVTGNTSELRKAALSYLHPEVIHSAGNAGEATLREIMSHPSTIALRTSLQPMAVNGEVLLYRGMSTGPVGHQPIESYSLNAAKAGAFAGRNKTENNRLYKVKVDDIIASIEDMGSGTLGHSDSEILVINRATRENLPVEEAARFFQPKELAIPAAHVPQEALLNAAALPAYIEQILMAQVKELSKLNFGIETIAKRTGASEETIGKILRQEPINAIGMTKFKSAEDITTALLPENRALTMSTNIDKHHSASIYSNLNAQNKDTLSRGLVEAFGKSSPSPFVRKISEELNSAEAKVQLNFLSKGLEMILPAGVRNPLFSSSNFTLDRLGAYGPLATGYGKRLINIRNRAKDEFTAPLSRALAPIVDDTAGLLEFNTAMNVGASISGKKVFKDGQWWKPNDDKVSLDSIMKADAATFRLWATAVNPKTGVAPMTAQTFKQADYKVMTPSVAAAIEQLQVAGRELYHLKNTENKIIGKGDLDDIWFWSPANNPRDKQIAYAFNRETQQTTMLMARTPSELLAHADVYRKGLGQETNVTDIVFKGKDQEYYNQLAGRHDPMYMGVSDASKQHGGASAAAIVSTRADTMTDLIQGYDHYINHGIDKLARLQLAPISQHLDTVSMVNQHGYSPDSLGKIAKAFNKPVDAGKVIGNILMGKGNLEESPGWATFQTGFQVMADRSLKVMADILSPVLSKTSRTTEDWNKVVSDMTARGIVNPFQTMETYLDSLGRQSVGFRPNIEQGREAFIGGASGNESLTPRLIALSNSAAATVILRAGDMAHAAVNLLGMPILTSAAISRRMEQNFLGATMDPMAKFSVLESMYNGVRLMNHHTEGPKWRKLAERENMLTPDWREMNGLMRQIRTIDKGLMTKLEDAIESKLVKFVSKASDKSEELSRSMAFFTGVGIAKKAYPTLGDAGIMTFARNFMDESIGNYTAAQRPAAFQGSLGVAMGLFQTYMVTYAQSMYRQIGAQDFKALGKMMLTQAGIFGTSSLPGFTPISEAIGTHFTDDHMDLKTGTFALIGDKPSQLLLYGLPSQLAGLTTRGDVSPRIPNLAAGLDTLVAVNVAGQAYDTAERVTRAAFTADANTGKAMLEALSLQSISRPLARMAELATGHAITRAGEVVDSDTWTWQSVAARVMATRPIEEIKAREARHLDSLYGAVDKENRRKVTTQLKSYIINGNLDEEKMEKLSNNYMRTSGSAQGWRAAVNEATTQANQPGNDTVRSHLKPNSPTMGMMNDFD